MILGLGVRADATTVHLMCVTWDTLQPCASASVQVCVTGRVTGRALFGSSACNTPYSIQSSTPILHPIPSFHGPDTHTVAGRFQPQLPRQNGAKTT